jgi:hypothetical protein
MLEATAEFLAQLRSLLAQLYLHDLALKFQLTTKEKSYQRWKS